jgi:hypothetical protein
MDSLQKIFDQLDKTRLALHANFIALDDDLEETYYNAIEEMITLKELLIKEIGE